MHPLKLLRAYRHLALVPAEIGDQHKPLEPPALLNGNPEFLQSAI